MKVTALQGDVKVNADLNGHMAKLVFEEGYENLKGTLWINDQEMKINPFKGTEFGPVLTDGSMSAQVEAQFPWGKLKSEKTPIEGEEIEVNLASDKGFMDDMMTAVVNHTKEAAKAFAKRQCQRHDNGRPVLSKPPERGHGRAEKQQHLL